jgi:hypothetical protein
MIHAKMVKPRWFPWNSARQPEQINRLQEITGDLALNRDKLYEIGRLNLLGYRKRTPSFTGKFRQFETGAMKFWYDLANKVDPISNQAHFVDESDFSTTIGDFSAYLTDDSSVFTGSIWARKLRVSGFTLNIADPDAMIERNISVIGEDYAYIQDNYFAYQTATKTGSGSLSMVLSPAAIAYASGKYIFRVLRVRAGEVTDLTLNEFSGSNPPTNSWEFDYITQTIVVQDCADGDIVKVFYCSATAYATTWTDNNSEPTVLLAEYCEISLKVGTENRIYRLQTVGIDVSLERTDYKEIGNNEIVQTGVKQVTTKISLNRFTEGFSLEDILASDTAFPLLEPADFADNIQMMVKIFGEKEHTNFKIGYLMDGISPTAVGNSQAIQDYNKATTTLECDNIKISDLESEIVFA